MNRAVPFSISIFQSIYNNLFLPPSFNNIAQWWIMMVMRLDIKLMATVYSDLMCDYLIGEIEHRVLISEMFL